MPSIQIKCTKALTTEEKLHFRKYSSWKFIINITESAWMTLTKRPQSVKNVNEIDSDWDLILN